MLEELKLEVYRQNQLLTEYGLVVLTWGNVSAVSKDRKYVVIKPSGMSYKIMKPSDMVVTDLEGNIVEGELRPSSDLATHLELYRSFANVGGIVHTHSRYATAFAQAEKPIPCFGTTHADSFYGAVPCTRQLTEREVAENYELNTGKVIAETFVSGGIDYNAVPAVLVSKHGPFTWGATAAKAVENALVLDEAAHIASIALSLDADMACAPQYLLNKHYYRKHGENAYYGQK